MGKTVGTTDLLLWDEKEEAIQMHIIVTVDLSYLHMELRRIFPGMPLEVSQSGNVLVVTGLLNRADAVTDQHSTWTRWA